MSLFTFVVIIWCPVECIFHVRIILINIEIITLDTTVHVLASIDEIIVVIVFKRFIIVLFLSIHHLW